MNHIASRPPSHRSTKGPKKRASTRPPSLARKTRTL
jgi:hypothetical protein